MSSRPYRGKKNGSFLEALEELIDSSEPVFASRADFLRARLHILSQLVCLGRHTITGLLRTSGQIFSDWSADYRFYDRFDSQQLFDRVAEEALRLLPQSEGAITVSMDDSILRKGGNHTHGVGWRRDPLSPPFHTNFVRGQRMLQLSLCVPAPDGSARSVPIDFQHAVIPKKPRKDAPAPEHDAYRKALKRSNINALGVRRIAHLRDQVDARRPLHLCVDGRFTNGTVLKSLAENTTLIGRIRKDAALHFPVDESTRAATGRRKRYGQAAPTPEELRQDPSIAWQSIQAFAAGKIHQFKVKRLGPLKWRKAGAQTDVQIVVIAPLSYRLRKKGKILYRQPAYLICTDPNLDLQTLLQDYLRRWDIEVNFRDEKTLLGLGEAQVRTESATQNVPALSVAAYAMLLMASIRTFGIDGKPDSLPVPKWQGSRAPARACTMSLIDHLRFDLWATALRPQSFSGFLDPPARKQTSEKLSPSLASALFSAVA